MFLVEISNLGRDEVSVEDLIPAIDYENLLGMVRPHLVSSDISFVINYGVGKVCAGIRTVGDIKITAL